MLKSANPVEMCPAESQSNFTLQLCFPEENPCFNLKRKNSSCSIFFKIFGLTNFLESLAFSRIFGSFGKFSSKQKPFIFEFFWEFVLMKNLRCQNYCLSQILSMICGCSHQNRQYQVFQRPSSTPDSMFSENELEVS